MIIIQLTYIWRHMIKISKALKKYYKPLKITLIKGCASLFWVPEESLRKQLIIIDAKNIVKVKAFYFLIILIEIIIIILIIYKFINIFKINLKKLNNIDEI